MVRVVGRAASYDRAIPDSGVPTRLLPGAFAASLVGGPPIQAQLNHRPTIVLGDDSGSAVGRLLLWEEPAGLFFTLTVVDPVKAAFLADMSRHITGVSVRWRERNEDIVSRNGVRAIARAQLVEVSIVTRPERPADAATWARLETRG